MLVKMLFFFLFICPLFSIQWMDKGGNWIKEPTEDTKFWDDSDKAFRKNDFCSWCLPPSWRDIIQKLDRANLIVKITDSTEIKDPNGEPACGAHTSSGKKSGFGMLFLRTKKDYKGNFEGALNCFCAEATWLHEIIHEYSGIDDSMNDIIDACVYSALKYCALGNCVNNIPKPNCECEDENGKKPPANCK